MPVSRSDSRRAVLIGVAAAAAAAAVGLLVISLSGEKNEVSFGGGDAEFVVGDAEARARAIDRDRTPLLFQDPARFERPIFVQHLGDDPDDGWVAFDAQVGGCALEWDRSAQRFVDCDGRRYPADGEGLDRYQTRVDDGEVVVDLDPDDETTTTGQPTTTILRTGD
ncbi:hypothetical protein BH18ACT4_BH18ACT4_04320 [soil metagenome]